MPVNVSGVIRTSFENDEWDDTTPITELPFIGEYLELRLRQAIRGRVSGGQLTMKELVQGFRGLGNERTVRILQKALQNRNANQCVPHSHGSPNSRTYHAADINEYGFESVASLLDYAKQTRLFSAGLRISTPLPRPRTRSNASRSCGCQTSDTCTGNCRWIDGLCVPKRNDSRGFPGVPTHPDQVVVANTDAERQRIRNRSRTRLTNAVRNSADSFADINSGNSREMRYVRRGSRMWRRPGSKVRVPIERRN